MTQKGTPSTPHDAVFKQFLSHPECARDFIEIHLPASLRQLCNLQTLKLESGSFIEADLRASYSDVLWSLKTRDGEGYIYVVIEHQSTPEAHMAFRLMRYALAAMQRHLMPGIKRCRWWCRCCFITARKVPIPSRFAGWMTLLIGRQRDDFMPPLSRSWILRWCRMTRLCSTGAWRCWS